MDWLKQHKTWVIIAAVVIFAVFFADGAPEFLGGNLEK